MESNNEVALWVYNYFNSTYNKSYDISNVNMVVMYSDYTRIQTDFVLSVDVDSR